mgnify:FL=1
MRHAYLITIHKNFRILEQFMKVLDQKGTDFYVLIDKKISTYIPKNSKVIELESLKINWGGASQIEAELNLLRRASTGSYDYYHFMQGADFPIKTKEEIELFFEINRGCEFIDYEPGNYEFAKYKCDYWHMFVNYPRYRTSKGLKILNHSFVKIQKFLRINRHDRELFHGSALFSITDECAKYILSKEKDIKKRYRYCLAADEVFLQTEIYNSKFRDRLYYNDERYSNARLIDWNRRSGNSPYVFKVEDFDLLINAKNKVFARKFEEEEYKIIDKLYKLLK